MKRFLTLFLCFILTACNNNEPNKKVEISIIEPVSVTETNTNISSEKIVSSTEKTVSNSEKTVPENTTKISENVTVENSTEENTDSIVVLLSINSDILNNYDMQGGEIADVSLSVSEYATVFDVLKGVCEAYDIELEYEGSSKRGTVYIKSINNISEKEISGTSGWIFKVNGESAMKSCSAYKLKNGDKIEFLYTDGKEMM